MHFKSATTKTMKAKGMLKDHLMRHKFIEILVRISKQKYIDADLEDTIPHAFERLMEECVKTKFVLEPWLEFRE